MLAFKLLWRNSHNSEIKLLATALALAVAVVTAIGVFSDRLEATLLKQSNSFLAADRQIYSPKEIPKHWLTMADRAGLKHVQQEVFSSMVFSASSDDKMQLASIKAVEQGYPLVGELEVSRTPFAQYSNEIFVANDVPVPGHAWIDSRLLAQLNINIDDRVFVGEKELIVSRVIIREPDRGGGFSLFSPRLMMNRADLAATEVIQPGSRIAYRWLLGGDDTSLKRFIDELRPQLTEHHQLVDLARSQQGLAKTLSRAREFLLLAIVMAVLLAGVAIVITANRFSQRQIDTVALLKSLGASRARVRALYIAQLFILAFISALLGLVIGEAIQQLITWAVQRYGAITLLPAPWHAYGLGVITGFICLLFFALPPLWHLPTISPLRVLRQDLPVSALRNSVQILLSLTAILLLIYLYSGKIWLTLSVATALCCVVLSAISLAALGLYLGNVWARNVGGVWRLALAGIWRRRHQSILQIVVFSIALLLLFTMYTVRTSLVEDWQKQLPEGSPNHFLLNIAPAEVEGVKALLQQRNILTAEIYPMVRGRLVSINGQEPSDEMRKSTPLLQREANISWSDNLPAENTLVSGEWWQTAKSEIPKVSVEADLAKRLSIVVGDIVAFSFGGYTQNAQVSSLRALRWDNMKPNFYFIFQPGSLDQFSPMYMTSLYLPSKEKNTLSHLLREYPTVVVLEIDKVIDQIRDIVNKVGRAVELVLAMVLVGGILVLAAAVNASIDSRLQEVGLIRALGSPKRTILGSLWIEFTILGAVAGVIAVLGAEALLLGLQVKVFNMPMAAHYELWFAGPLLGALLVGALGVWSCRKVIITPPAVVLRELS